MALALQTGIALRLATHPWFDRTLAVIDFETTGFSPSDSRITEYGLVLVRNEISIETYTSLINPGIPIPKDITTITGIDDAMVADAPKEPLVMREILAALEHAQMIGGHNYTDFDSKFLNATLTRCGLEPSTLPVFDTLHLARKYILGQENYKQPTLLASLGWSGTVFHRALADAQGCAFILRAVLRSASGVDDFLDQAIPLALLDQAGLDLKTLLADSLGLGQSIAAIIPRFSDQSAAPRREVTSRSQIFCTRFHASDQECGLYLSELGSLAAGTQSQGITLLLEHVPGSAGLRTVLPQDGLILDLPGLALIVRAAPEVWKDEEVRPDGHYDLILCLDSQPVEGVAAGTLLDMRLNPLALRA